MHLNCQSRVDEAIEILEYLVSIKEKNLGTMNTEVDDEKKFKRNFFTNNFENKLVMV